MNHVVKSMICKHFFKFALFVSSITLALSAHAGQVTGELNKWSPITVDFIGPSASETDRSPNPFLDYKLDVTFTAPSGKSYLVPGFFAGNGQGGGTGEHWQVRFAADEVGQWRYQASMRQGSNVAIDTNSSAGSNLAINNAEGQFSISAQSTSAPGFLKYGRLEYTGEHYLKFRDGPYWIKSGTDSPENFLGYAGIDGTVDQNRSPFLHDYATHRGDARDDDPLFRNSSNGFDSRGITGALNYLSDQGVNSIYFLPMNLGGDGQETFPFVGGQNNAFNKTHYDISKLYQWNQVLNHAQRRGIALNIVLSETEPGNERWFDNGKLGVERKLYFRELIARFGYLLAAKWNLGEENDFPVSELRLHADYLNKLDWTKKPIAVHTQINNFRDYEKLVGDKLFSASSIQYDPPLADEFVETWRKRSREAGRKWVIDMDENTGGVSDRNADTRRKQITYDVYFSGGNLEWYYGYHPLPLGGDITAGDFRQREATWKTMRYAREFMQQNLPFWRMEPADQLVSGAANSFGGAEVFAATNDTYAIYFPNASGNATLDLSQASGSFSQRWFNPRNGQFAGDTKTVVGGKRIPIGSPPSARNDDWVVLIKSHNAQDLPDYSVGSNPEPASQPELVAVQENAADDDNQSEPESQSNNDDAIPPPPPSGPNDAPVFNAVGDLAAAMAGTTYKLTVAATDAQGVAPVITAETLPAGMRFASVVDGVVSLEWQVPSDASGSVSFELIAIDVQDRSLQATLPINIRVDEAPSAEPEPETKPEPEEVETITDETTDEEPASALVDNSAAPTTQASETPVANPAANGDQPPAIMGADDARILAGKQYRKTIVPVDPEGIVASLRIVSPPAGASFVDNGNGTRDLIWTPKLTDTGSYDIKFIATDAGNVPHVVQKTMKLVVVQNPTALITITEKRSALDRNAAPVFRVIEDQQVAVGETLSFAVRPIDPEGIAPILHVNSPPANSRFTDNGDGTRTFTWVATAEHVGDWELQFTATDSLDVGITSTYKVAVKVIP